MAVTVAVVGCGSIARMHAPAFAEAGAVVRYACDPNVEAARAYAERHGARPVPDWREAVADPEVGVVLVAAHTALHREVCLAAIAKGKAVICEKTLGATADEALEIVAAARRAGVPFWTCYMKRFLPAIEKAKELLPRLGTLATMHIRSDQCWCAPWAEVPPGSWLHAAPGQVSACRRGYSGGMLAMGGSHMFDLVGHFLGRPKRLFALMHTPAGSDADLLASVLLETDSAHVHFEAFAHNLRRLGPFADGLDEGFEISGEHGRLEYVSGQWDQPLHKTARLVHYDNAAGARTEYRFDPVSPFVRATTHFLALAEAGIQGSQSELTGYDVDELIAHTVRSAAERRALDIEYRIG